MRRSWVIYRREGDLRGKPISLRALTASGVAYQGIAALFAKFRTLLARPGARSAALNLGWLVGEKLVRLVLHVGVGFAVARHLGPMDFGKLNYVLAVVGLMGLLAELGLDGVVRRELVQAPERALPLLVVTLILRLAGGVVSYALLISMAQWADWKDRELLAILGLTLFQPALMVADPWFQSRLRAKYSVWAQVAALAVGAAGRILLIVIGAPLSAFAWVIVAEMAMIGAGLFWLARRDGLRWRFRVFETRLAGRLLREAWPLMLSGLAIMLYMRMDAVMLRVMSGEAAVGIYAAATRFTEIWYFLPVALASSLLPSLLRARERGAAVYAERLQLCFDLNAGMAYLLSVPVALAAPWLVRWAYGAEFAAAAPVLAVHIWSSVFVFLGIVRGQFLVNEGRTGFYLWATVAGLLVNAGLNFVLIPHHGPWGAAVATMVAQMVAAWLSSFCFAPVRETAWMQTRALCIPVRLHHYVRRT